MTHTNRTFALLAAFALAFAGFGTFSATASQDDSAKMMKKCEDMSGEMKEKCKTRHSKMSEEMKEKHKAKHGEMQKKMEKKHKAMHDKLHQEMKDMDKEDEKDDE